MRNKYLLIASLLVSVLSFFIQKETFADGASPFPIEYKQPDGNIVTIKLKGDERLSWAETLDGYTLLTDGKNGWAYAVLNADGDLVSSGILTHNQAERTVTETGLLQQISKKLRYSPKQIENIKSSSEVRLKSASRIELFNPNGARKLLMILVQFSDLDRDLRYSQSDFNGLMNTIGYNVSGAQGSVKDFFLENSYGAFNITTDVVGPYRLPKPHDYYGADNGAIHDINFEEFALETIKLADAAGVDFSKYDSDADGVADGVYIIFQGWSQAHSGIVNDIWSKAGTINYTITNSASNGTEVGSVSCSNELLYESTDHLGMSTIGVICHEFGHVCNAPDYYDTDYETDGEYNGTGEWDLMCGGNNNGTTATLSGNTPAHFNPYTKMRFGWLTPVELTAAGNYTLPDITSNKVNAVYKINTNEANEYFLLENRQQTGFNQSIPGHGLVIYHKDNRPYMRGETGNNRTHPQSLYAVCATASTAIPTSDAASYGDINSAGCSFPGSSNVHGFYDTGIPSSKSWAGVNTDMPITNIAENLDGTISFTISVTGACVTAPNTQATAFVATPTFATSMDISWTRGNGDKVLVVAREASAVDFDPLSGDSYTANANFKAGSELGAGNYVVYDGTGTLVTLTGLNGNTQYFFAVYEYNSATNCYLNPALTGNGTTNCTYDPATFNEGFERSSFGCWTVVDNQGNGQVWKLGTYSTAANQGLTGNYAYLPCAGYGSGNAQNTDLISPTFDLSGYNSVILKFNHYYKSYTGTSATVYYSIDNGSTWIQLYKYTTSTSNPDAAIFSVNAATHHSQVKFKWNFTSTNWGFYWSIDDVKVLDSQEGIWTGITSADWHTARNWSNNAVPTASTNAVIPTGVTNMPYISSIVLANCKDITLHTGTTLKMAANTELDVKGNWINNGNYDYANSISSALVKYNGTSTQTYSGSTVLTLRKFEVDNTSGITIQKELRADNIALKNGMVLTDGTAKLNLFGGTLTRTNGWVNGTLQKYIFTNPSSQKIVSFEIGDASNYIPVQITFPIGSITVANGLAVKTTTGDYSNIASSTLNSGKSVNRYWSFPYNGITFSSCDIVFNYLSSDLDASVSTANLIAGKYTASAWTYPIVGLKTSTSTQITGISSFGDFQLAENFGKTSTGGNWSADASWSPSGVPVVGDNVLILSPGTVVVDVTNAVCQELAVQSGAKLQIDPAKALTISNTLTNNSTASGVTIRSDATGTGSLVAGSASGQATVESYLTANKWHIVSPTASGGSISTFIQAGGNDIPSKTGSYGMMDYNENGNSWNSYYTSSTLENLTSGKGYSVRRTADGVVTFIGNLTSGSKSINLTKTGTEGWNCVGNPYPSAIYLNTAANATSNFLKTNAIDASNLDASYACIYVWDQEVSGYKILGNVSYDSRDLGQNIFQSGQGFFVKANNGSSSIEFTPAMQVHQSSAVLKSAQTTWPGFELTAANTQTKASTMVTFNNTMTNGLDPTYDAGLLRGISGLELYSRLVDDNGVDFAIQCLPETYNSLVIPIGVESKTGGEITFSAEIVELPASCSVILEDKLAKTFTSLADGATYKATVSAGTTAVGRFFIHTNSSTTGTSELSSGAFSLKAYPANGQIWIVGEVARGAKASLFDVSGRNLGTFNLQEGSRNSISSAGLASGVYLLNVIVANKMFNTKIVIY